ncbi:MAG: alpha/beta hydrolase [Thermodesulfobacteriota bacterium]
MPPSLVRLAVLTAVLAGLVWHPGALAAPPSLEEDCSCPVPVAIDPQAYTLYPDLPYNTVDGEPLLLDAAIPHGCTAASRCGLVLVLHGGGFAIGDKAEGGGAGQRRAIEQLASLGYVAISANYRLARPRMNKFPAAVQDSRCLVRWSRRYAAALGIDPERIVMTGVSAGGGLTASVATMDDATWGPGLGIDDWNGYTCQADEPGQPRRSSTVTAAVVYYGTADFRIPLAEWGHTAPLIVNYLGALPRRAPVRALAASPIAYVRATTPPMLLLHGQVDDTVPYAQSEAMAQALIAAGVPNRLVGLADVGHSFLMFDKDYFALAGPEDDTSGLPACTGQEPDGSQCLVETPQGPAIMTAGALRCTSCTSLRFLAEVLAPPAP